MPQVSLLIYLAALVEQTPLSHAPTRGLLYFYNLTSFSLKIPYLCSAVERLKLAQSYKYQLCLATSNLKQFHFEETFHHIHILLCSISIQFRALALGLRNRRQLCLLVPIPFLLSALHACSKRPIVGGGEVRPFLSLPGHASLFDQALRVCRQLHSWLDPPKWGSRQDSAALPCLVYR